VNRGRRQRGSSLLMVLMTLALGTLLLRGLGLHYRLRQPILALEIQRIQMSSRAHSALAWGMRQTWAPTPAWQCREAPDQGRACLRTTAGDEGVLMGQDGTGTMRYWQWVTTTAGLIRAQPRGWSDFCPLADGECEQP
jgi:Tfp pilus assembly protein PilX